jgi:hypothetical protein
MDEQKARLSSLRVCLGTRNLANDLIQVHLVLGRLAESAAELRGANTKPRANSNMWQRHWEVSRPGLRALVQDATCDTRENCDVYALRWLAPTRLGSN